MFDIGNKVARSAKRAGYVTGGTLLCVVGTGFLTVSAWLALEPVVGTLQTTLILAGAYIGIGLVLIGAGRSEASESPQEPVSQPSQPVDGPPVLQAFIHGMQAGARAHQPRSS